MGLVKDFKMNNGMNITSAYFRINAINGDKDNIYFSLVVYVSREVFLEGKEQLGTIYYNFIPDLSDESSNFFKQAYTYLKLIDDFRDANDVLEKGQTPV